MLRPILIAAFMLVASASANASPAEDAFAAYQKGDYAAALKLLKPLAEQGNDKAQLAILAKFDMDTQGEIMAKVATMELRDTQGLMPLYGKDEGAQ